MLSYVTLGCSDLDRALPFYDALLGALGHRRLPGAGDGWQGWGRPEEAGATLWLCPPFDGGPVSIGNGTMLALAAASPAEVVAAHRAALAAGGRDEGAPGLRPHYGPGFFAAYLRDPEGHKLAVVHVTQDPD